MLTNFEKELRQLINRYSIEGGSNTPDFILAQYLVSCLFAYNVAVRQRAVWGQDEVSKSEVSEVSEVSNVKIDR